jgi:glutaredoxin/glutathione-dependent peroxiredoxin
VQIPGYLQNQDAIKDAGIDEILIISVNDGAVMGAWFEQQKLQDSILQMMGDPTGQFTEACGIELTAPGPISKGLLGRSKRVAMIVVKNVVQYIAISESPDDPAGDNDPSATSHAAIIRVCTDVLKLNLGKE